MTKEYYGVNVGDNDGNGTVTTGTSDTSKDIQIVVNNPSSFQRKDVKRYGDRLIRFITAEDTASVFGS